MIALAAFLQPAATALNFDTRAFDAAVALAQSLTQWGFLIIAGSVVILVGTSYYRPSQPVVRRSYLLFLVAWLAMGISIFRGIQVQMANVARLFEFSPDLMRIRETMRHDASSQIWYMEASLYVFGAWLLIFSIWWVLHAPDKDHKPKSIP